MDLVKPVMPFLTALLAGLLAAGAAHAGDKGLKTPEAQAQYHVMVGEMAALRQQPELAANEFLLALESVPDPELAMRAASLALAAKNEPLALKAAKKWQALAPAEMDPREAVARLALRAGELKEVRSQCEAIIAGHPGGPDEGFRQVAQLLGQEGGKREDALALMQQLRNQYADRAGAAYAQSLLALRYGALDLAEKAARDALKLKPGARDTLLLLTGVLVKKGDLVGSKQAIEQLIKDSKEPVELRMGYARVLLESEHLAEARAEYEAVLAVKPNDSEAHFALGLLALEQQDNDAGEKHFRALLESPELKQRATYYLGRIEETRGHWAEAIKWYEQVTEGEQSIDALTRRAVALGRLDRVAEARALMLESRSELPAFASRFYLAEGELLMNAHQGKEALALYEQALKERPEDVDLLYGRSLVQEQLSNVPDAEADLRRILAKDKDDARAMNALGYMLTVHTNRYDEARKLIERALELNPDDAAVIDSLGWVEYRQGKVKEARALLEKAFSKARDPEIAAHYGEVLWTLGEKDQARKIWDAALAKDPDHRVLRETVDRLAR